MAPYGMFVEYLRIGASERRHDPFVLLEGTTEKEASNEASAKADSLYPEHATEVFILIVGGPLDDGRPIGEIRRPRSD